MTKEKAPRSFETQKGATVFVGRNAVQNDQLLAHFQDTAPNTTTWFHVADRPGCHVFLVDSTDPEDVREAARAAVVFSKTMFGSSSVEFCLVSNVFKPKKAAPGEVCLLDDPRTVRI